MTTKIYECCPWPPTFEGIWPIKHVPKNAKEILKCKSRNQGHLEEIMHWSKSSLHSKVHYVHILLQLNFILPQIV